MATNELQKASESAKAIMLKLHEQFPRLGTINFDISYEPETGKPILLGLGFQKHCTPEDYEPGAKDAELGEEEMLSIFNALDLPASEEIRALALQAGISAPTTARIFDKIASIVAAGIRSNFIQHGDPENVHYSAQAVLGIVKGFDDGPQAVSRLPEGAPMFWVSFERTELASLSL